MTRWIEQNGLRCSCKGGAFPAKFVYDGSKVYPPEGDVTLEEAILPEDAEDDSDEERNNGDEEDSDEDD